MYLIKLDCGHTVHTEIMLVLNHEKDQHYIYCPSCREDPKVPLAWNPVVSNVLVSDVPSESSPILPGDILRVPGRRSLTRPANPFPYVTGRGQF